MKFSDLFLPSPPARQEGCWLPVPMVPPMPGVREARLDIIEARRAIDRAAAAWNPSQLEDAIRSARFFLSEAESACKAGRAKPHIPQPAHEGGR